MTRHQNFGARGSSIYRLLQNRSANQPFRVPEEWLRGEDGAIVYPNSQQVVHHNLNHVGAAAQYLLSCDVLACKQAVNVTRRLRYLQAATITMAWVIAKHEGHLQKGIVNQFAYLFNGNPTVPVVVGSDPRIGTVFGVNSNGHLVFERYNGIIFPE